MKDIDHIEEAYKNLKESASVLHKANVEHEENMNSYFALLEAYRLGLKEGKGL
jgi:hypothetical protein